ncbi:RNA polymerase sigma factor, partial [Nonomuraea aridisoli]
MTWQALSDEAQAAIGEVCRVYGAALADYCRAELSEGDAEQAACAALISAHDHVGRLAEPEQLRAWLYALARAHRTLLATANAASTGSWTRPGAGSLLAEALTALPKPYQEVLDLAVRHRLSHLEIALIFDAGAVEVEHLVAAAAHRLETWIAAVSAARSGGCQELAKALAGPAPPSRRLRTHISQHIDRCVTCQSAPRTTTAAALLQQMPIKAAPATMAVRLTEAQPLAGDVEWRADGFPPQTHTLQEALADLPPAPAARPAAGGHGNRPAPDRDEEFRAWERRSQASEEFWDRRDDEADPEARLSLRPLLPVVRVGGLIVAGVATVLGAGAAWSSLQPNPRPVAAVAPGASATVTLLADPPLLDPLPEDPPTEQRT